MLSGELKLNIQSRLSKAIGRKFELKSVRQKGGGSINHAYVLDTTIGSYFLKVNSASAFPAMFERESEGLRTLGENSELKVPDVICFGEVDNTAYLILEYIVNSSPKKNFWDDFGEKLAKLHRLSATEFGFEKDNYIGSLPQSNRKCKSWPEFFVKERLEPLVKKARDRGEIDSKISAAFDVLYGKLDSFFPGENPSFIHGDLWSGNFMADEGGDPAIFDPAVYFGHREMDIGMSRLFGGFDRAFYESYNHHYPMERGWRDRLEVANLYPLLVHVILFGGSYAMDVQRILRRMV